MDAASSTPPSSTPPQGAFVPAAASGFAGDEDVAIGCECANPALQIDSWRAEAAPGSFAQTY